MARKSRNSRYNKTSAKLSPRRVTTANPSRRLHRETITISRRQPLLEIQDGRRFSPLKKELRPLLDLMASPVEVKAQPLLKKYSPHALFQVQGNALLCARRALRKEVLFAKGKGGKQTRRPKFNHNSKIGCK